MALPLPPWIQPLNPAPYYLQGVGQGEQIAALQNQAELAIQEMTLRREAQQRHNEAQNLAAARTVQQMEIAAAEAQEQARQAAMKWEWQNEMSRRIAAGEDPITAWEATTARYSPEDFGSYATRKAEQEAITKRMEERTSVPELRTVQGKGVFRINPQTGESVLVEAVKPEPVRPPTTLPLALKGQALEIEDSLKLYRDELKELNALNELDDKQSRRKSVIEDVINGLIQRRNRIYSPDVKEPSLTPPPLTNSVTSPSGQRTIVQPPTERPVPLSLTNEPNRFGEGKPLDEALARAFLRQAGGDRNKARKLAREAGYVF